MLNEEMAASYTVEITGIERTRAELAQLDGAIKSLRKTPFSSSGSATVASSLGSADIFVTKFDDYTGRVQSTVERAMTTGMALGRRTQAIALEQAITETGLTRPGNGPGRNKTGKMIRAIRTNVEVYKSPSTTRYTGWHGWAKDARLGYEEYQERGTRGRGQTSRTLASAGGSVNRRKNRAYGHDFAGKKRGKGAGVPAANSLGAAIVPVREHLKRELRSLKR